nr:MULTISPECIES: hypothetical protein [unclassified Klebsiella]
MTKSTITRERLEEIRDCCWMDDLGLSMYELSELASMALVAMDSEPVAWRWRWSDDVEGYWRYTEEQRETHGSVTAQPLYRHAQQPVVPEEATSDSIEILASARRRDHAVFQWDEDQRNAAADSWNACRAAMLAAAPQEVKP